MSDQEWKPRRWCRKIYFKITHLRSCLSQGYCGIQDVTCEGEALVFNFCQEVSLLWKNLNCNTCLPQWGARENAEDIKVRGPRGKPVWRRWWRSISDRHFLKKHEKDFLEVKIGHTQGGVWVFREIRCNIVGKQGSLTCLGWWKSVEFNNL